MSLMRFFLAVSFVLSVLAGCGDTTVPAGEGVVITEDRAHKNPPINRESSESYEVKINNHLLKIPMSYLGQAPGDGRFVSLYTAWPDFGGFKKGTKGDLADGIEILIRGEPEGAPDGQVIADPADRLFGGSGVVDFVKFDDSKLYGIPYSKIPDRIQYYTPQNTSIKKWNGHRFYIACSPRPRWPENPESVECEVRDYIRSDVIVTYRFYEKNIRHWKVIDGNVKALVESYFLR